MTGSLLVRRATSEDVSAFIQLIRESRSAPQWVDEQVADIVAASVTDETFRCVIVATCDNDLTGFVVMSAAAGEAELESIVVSRKHRRRGIGLRLWEAALAWALEREVTQVWLEVRESNSPARELYRTVGFEETGIRPQYYRDPEEGAVAMRKVLLPATHL